jgi:hypothetical protein
VMIGRGRRMTPTFDTGRYRSKASYRIRVLNREFVKRGPRAVGAFGQRIVALDQRRRS